MIPGNNTISHEGITNLPIQAYKQNVLLTILNSIVRVLLIGIFHLLSNILILTRNNLVQAYRTSINTITNTLNIVKLLSKHISIILINSLTNSRIYALYRTITYNNINRLTKRITIIKYLIQYASGNVIALKRLYQLINITNTNQLNHFYTLIYVKLIINTTTFIVSLRNKALNIRKTLHNINYIVKQRVLNIFKYLTEISILNRARNYPVTIILNLTGTLTLTYYKVIWFILSLFKNVTLINKFWNLNETLIFINKKKNDTTINSNDINNRSI